MARYRSFRDFDWPLLIITLIICALGVLQIYSATHDYRTATHDYRDAWWKQIVYILIALGVMWVTASVDYHTLMAQTPILYGISIVGLLATFFLGKRVAGGRRWLFHLQISEFVKLVIILLVARYLSELKSNRMSARDLFKLGGLVGIPTALVVAQPDFSTGATYVPILIVGILLAGVQWRHVVLILLACALAAPVGWFMLKDFQKERLLTFRDPSRDPQGRGYQVIQSEIA